MKLLVGKNKYGEKVELTISEKELSIVIEAKEEEDKKKSKKDKEEVGFGSYSNTFDRSNALEMKGLKSLSDGRTEITLKFAGETRRISFVVQEEYKKVAEMF